MQLKSIALFFSSPFLSVFALLNKKEMRGNPVCGSARTAAREGATEKKNRQGDFFFSVQHWECLCILRRMTKTKEKQKIRQSSRKGKRD